MRSVLLVVSVLVLAAGSTAQAPAPVAPEAVRIVDLSGRQHTLPAADGRPTVLAWISLDCPMSRLYLPRLVAMAGERSDARWVLVASSRQDSELELRGHDALAAARIPVVRDVDARIARALEVTRTTEVLLFDGAGALRYRGAVDDQNGFSRTEDGRADAYRKDAPERRWLAEALDALARGEPVATSRTEAWGCALDPSWREAGDVEGAPTFHAHVEPILRARCQDCHRRGAAGPFPLETWEDVRGWPSMIAEVVSDGTMPPWNANPAHGTFANARVLDDREKKIILDWVAAGAPRGDEKLALAPLVPEEGWAIGEPDLVIELPEQEIPATGRVDYRYVEYETSFEEDRWIAAYQARSTSPQVVHHVLGFLKQERRARRRAGGPWAPPFNWGNLVANVPREERMGYLQRVMRSLDGTTSRHIRGGGGLDGYLLAELPGSGAMIHPEGRAQFLPAGATIVFQLHYTPNGRAATSRTSIALRFADAPPREVLDTRAIATVAFRLAPGESDQVVEASYVLPRAATLLALQPHMHLRGRAFRYVAVDPETGAEEILLDVPAYDFDWQHDYVLAEPRRLEKGTVLKGIARFDNSADNPDNPDPQQEVYFGLQTDEEMMIGYFRVIWDARDAGEGDAGAGDGAGGAESGAAD